jgi:hypothetical protein
MELTDLCIHKDIAKTREYVLYTFGRGAEESVAPIGYCKQCPGKLDTCFYYYSLGSIRRRQIETNK